MALSVERYRLHAEELMDPELERFILGQVLQRFLQENFGGEEREEIAGPELAEIEAARESGAAGRQASMRREARTADELFMSRLARSNANNPDLFPDISQVVIEPGRFVGRGTEANLRMNQPRIAPDARASFSDPEIAEQLLQDIFFRAQRESRVNEFPNRAFQGQLASGGRPMAASFETGARTRALGEQAGDVTLGDLAELLSAGAADVNLAERRSGNAVMQVLRDLNFLIQGTGAQETMDESQAFNRSRR